MSYLILTVAMVKEWASKGASETAGEGLIGNYEGLNAMGREPVGGEVVGRVSEAAEMPSEAVMRTSEAAERASKTVVSVHVGASETAGLGGWRTDSIGHRPVRSRCPYLPAAQKPQQKQQGQQLQQRKQRQWKWQLQ